MDSLNEAAKGIGEVSDEEILRNVRTYRKEKRAPEITVADRSRQRSPNLSAGEGERRIRPRRDESQISARFDGNLTADPCIRPQWLPDSLEDSGSLRHPVNL